MNEEKLKKRIAYEINFLLKTAGISLIITIIVLIIFGILMFFGKSDVFQSEDNFFETSIAIFLMPLILTYVIRLCIGIYKLFMWSEREKD